MRVILKLFCSFGGGGPALFRAFTLLLSLFIAPAAFASETGAILDPSARLPEGKKAWEYWDLVAEADSGHKVFARFMITNIGPGSHNTVVVGHVVFPDGSVYEWDDGEIEGDWTLADDRRRLDIGDSHLELRDPSYRIEINKDDMTIDLSFAPLAGTQLANEASGLDLRTDTLALSTEIQGRVGAPDDPDGSAEIVGLAAFTHSWGSEPEPESLLRRIELISMKDGLGFQVVDLTSSQMDRNRWLLVSRGNEVIYMTQDFDLDIFDVAPDHEQKKYWVPGNVKLNGSSLSGSVTSSPVEVVLNPLGLIPQPFRFIVSLSMKPHRVWAPAEVDVKLDTGDEMPLHIQTTGTLVTTFLDHLPRPKN